MFGYVRPPLGILPQEEQDRFRRIYCGLCHTLGQRYGIAARFILNYDFTYLAILLSGAEEGATKESRCPVSPIKRHPYVPENEALVLAADESVILAYWQLRDGVSDHDWLHGLKYRSLSKVLEPAYKKAAVLRSDFAKKTRTQLEVLAKLEKENCASLDAPADAFAQLLAAAAEEVDDPIRSRILAQMLYHLGRWVYLVDAADDLKKDLAAGDYNPVALRYGMTHPEWKAADRNSFALTLDHSIHMITTAFELWDFGVWTPILQETFYNGLFQVGKSVLDGTYHAKRRFNERKNTKKNEETK